MTTIAEQLMTAAPPVSAYSAEPFTIAEMDAHPDAARIWATIEAMKAGMEREIEARVEEELSEGDAA